MAADETTTAGRKAISKGLRFEIFKRDSFRCVYCGAEAPNVVLHVDHILAVAAGGTNDVTNLVTACAGCNLGKSDRALSENAAVSKSRAQLDELQERREQLELMMTWRAGLRDIESEYVDSLATYWGVFTPNFTLSESGRAELAKLTRKYSLDEICTAMDASANCYLRVLENGDVTEESFDIAFAKIPGICRVNKAKVDDPEIAQLFYIRGILRNRIPGYFKPHVALDYLKSARRWGVDMESLSELAKSVRNWTQFRTGIEFMIDTRKRMAAGESAE